MSFNDFKDELAEALGATAARDAKDEMTNYDPGVEPAGSTDVDPEEQVIEQATKIAEAIKTYLIGLDDGGRLRTPGGS